MPCQCSLITCLCGGQSSSDSDEGNQSVSQTNLTELQTGPRDVAMDASWLRDRGSQLVHWIDNATEPGCPVSKNTQSSNLLRRHGIQVVETRLSGNLSDIEQELILPLLREMPRIAGDYKKYTISMRHSSWHGYISPNIIAATLITRKAGSTDPHTSDIALAMFTRHHDLGGLRYVFAETVTNRQTNAYIKQILFPGEIWPPAQPRLWAYGTRQYDEIMGTRIGRTVGYFVLAGYNRGTTRITGILAYSSSSAGPLMLRFDIGRRR
ncbi:hypothetical protein PMG11_10612 [Penicillium brasilianum]|uniref:Uncharacterized protein n=1 Tax=Penicillium brasilianum TaxID=104259 RepID=A0A0F7U3Z3_PENBI|nr:hypothetical protein PMG11_10612 [Penicillium brasilianum]